MKQRPEGKSSNAFSPGIGEFRMKRQLLMMLICLSTFCLTGCDISENHEAQAESEQHTKEYLTSDGTELSAENDMPGGKQDSGMDNSTEPVEVSEPEKSLLNSEGMTLETRVQTPEGYTRTAAEEGSLASFLRTYPLKEAGSPVLLYDGREKGNQNAHAAVFELPIENEDLQQCADSIMRVYAEYFYHTGQYDRISFHFVNGFQADYVKWREGYRIQVSGNDVSWVSLASYDESYKNFQEYLRIVFAYSGTLSMETESREIALSEIQAGDVFLKGGSPGHVVLVVDVCVKEDGSKAFLLAQGYMPAQEFHLLKNPLHEEDPWYYEEEVTYPFSTPEYTFPEGSLRRLDYET